MAAAALRALRLLLGLRVMGDAMSDGEGALGFRIHGIPHLGRDRHATLRIDGIRRLSLATSHGTLGLVQKQSRSFYRIMKEKGL